MQHSKPILVIACGALAREIHALKKAHGWTHLKLTCIDPTLHFRPERIGPALRETIAQHRDEYEQIYIAYADCGSQGEIDRICADEAVERLPGAHCYQFFAGDDAFAALSDEAPGTFFLTDFLARHFDRLVVRALKLRTHPELIGMFFGNYTRLVYLAQTRDDRLRAQAIDAAQFLGLEYHEVHTGYGQLEQSLHAKVGIRKDGKKSPGLLA